MKEKHRAARNKTITLSDDEYTLYSNKLCKLERPVQRPEELYNQTINQDILEVTNYLPKAFVDLLVIDPPYNMNKKFNDTTFSKMDSEQYSLWLDSWFAKLIPTLKPKASVYICGDWRSSHSIFEIASKYLKIQNRITWEREKGRGAQKNWKNASEDIWFCSVSDDYTFNVEEVKTKRKVIAPYRYIDGKPKDWDESEQGNYRLTHPSNLWTDLTVPFWSMAENTDHPTQKPEKLIAKLILASSNKGNVVLDPFCGSGTTSVVAKKLGRTYIGIDLDPAFCCLTEKRLAMAEITPSIQGYAHNVFWDRNSGRI